MNNAREIEELWAASRLDENWQAEQWGVDEEAEEQASAKESGFYHAKIFADLARVSR